MHRRITHTAKAACSMCSGQISCHQCSTCASTTCTSQSLHGSWCSRRKACFQRGAAIYMSQRHVYTVVLSCVMWRVGIVQCNTILSNTDVWRAPAECRGARNSVGHYHLLRICRPLYLFLLRICPVICVSASDLSRYKCFCFGSVPLGYCIKLNSVSKVCIYMYTCRVYLGEMRIKPHQTVFLGVLGVSSHGLPCPHA